MIRTITLLALSSLFLGTAFAKKKGGGDGGDDGKLRVKASTAIFHSSTLSADEADPSQELKTKGLTLGTQPARLQATYKLGKGFEAGASLAYSKETATLEIDGEGDEGDPVSHMELMAVGAYNFEATDNLNAFVEVLAGLANDKTESDGGDSEVKWKGAELGAGVRFKAGKRGALDLGLAYDIMKGTPYFDDEEVEDGAMTLKSIQARTGVSVRF